MSPSLTSRRHFLSASALGALATGLGTHPASAAPAPTGSFTFAFLTDIHVQPEKAAGEGLTRCLTSVNDHPSRPDFVHTGGDLVMDSLLVDRARLKVQWDLFDECWKRLEIPSHHTIGNHDVGGWARDSLLSPDDAAYGKAYFADRYGQGRTYRSFDHKGWHFIVLDSIGADPGTERGFLGWIDEAQIDWLRADLEKTPKTTPIIVITHIPFFSVVFQYLDDPRNGPNKQGLVNNAHAVRKLFAKHNLKLVLSGHGHVLEKIDLAGITYIQGGSVCGRWWRGRLFNLPEGYNLITCHPDSTFTHAYEGYGWQAVGS